MRLICHEGLTESFLLTWGEPVARGAQKIADLGRGGRLCVRGDRSCLAGRGDGIDGVGQALLAWRREHEGGSDARVEQASPSGVPVKIEQSSVGEHAHDRVGVRGPGEFVDNGRVGVGHVQCRKARTGHEAWVGDADGGSREVVVAVVVVVDESPAECVVSRARVAVGAVGAFRGEAAFEGFAHRFGQERPGDGVGRCDRVRVEFGDAWRRPVVGGEDAELFVGEASRRGSVHTGGGGVCCEESASGASEGFGAGRFSQGRGRGECRHCLSFHSTTLWLLYKCEALRRRDTPTMAAISETASAPQAFLGNASSRNEKSGNLTSCLLVGGVLFRPLAIRYDVFPGHRGYDTPGSQKAPSAKRCIKTGQGKRIPAPERSTVRKHRAPNGALRPNRVGMFSDLIQGQKAPSAKRCIKTSPTRAHKPGKLASESTKHQKVH